ncbi:3-hydroxyacyl-CoA dehydrogenase NAD-binding domain-containing protein [Streptomyces sp. NPDC015345]|uniref:3-hydroxyacyl-CoA dehydrogenase NAD-binding domain-containing protein n=1 Tax=Streptomyces sp. NPDC015345 TaxID=3364953 RepID=UPI0036FC6B6A
MTRFGIVGGGLMGHGIAVALAVAGHHVVVYDADCATLASLDERVLRALGRCEMPPDDAVPVAARITAARTLSDMVVGVDAVLEAVPERLDVKQQVLEALEAIIPAVMPVWSNTSVLSLTAGLRRPVRTAVSRPSSTRWTRRHPTSPCASPCRSSET